MYELRVICIFIITLMHTCVTSCNYQGHLYFTRNSTLPSIAVHQGVVAWMVSNVYAIVGYTKTLSKQAIRQSC